MSPAWYLLTNARRAECPCLLKARATMSPSSSTQTITSYPVASDLLGGRMACIMPVPGAHAYSWRAPGVKNFEYDPSFGGSLVHVRLRFLLLRCDKRIHDHFFAPDGIL